MKEIAMIGNSKKFHLIIKSIYPGAYLHVIPWRSCDKVDTSNLKLMDLVVICGYDYSSNNYNFKKYMRANVHNPINLLKSITNNNTKLIYINTAKPTKKYTYSRYLFAKIALGNKLIDRYSELITIYAETITVNENVDIYGGAVSKLIFNWLYKRKFLGTVSYVDLSKKISCKKNDFLKLEKIYLKPKLLKVRRPLILDRLLRMFLG